jgi:ElaB/YqjD/DUF883 family membrane-anchored ribosome-binding protein
MADDTVHPSAQTPVSEAVAEAIDSRQKQLTEALARAEKTLTEAARRAERAIREGVESLRTNSKDYTDNAGQRFDDAQKYMVERVKERPVTAALAGVGVGMLLGLLLSNRSR